MPWIDRRQTLRIDPELHAELKRVADEGEVKLTKLAERGLRFAVEEQRRLNEMRAMMRVR